VLLAAAVLRHVGVEVPAVQKLRRRRAARPVERLHARLRDPELGRADAERRDRDRAHERRLLEVEAVVASIIVEASALM